MSGGDQPPCNGLARLLWDADPEDSPQEIVAEKDRFECSECGWVAELRRTECMVCSSTSPLQPREGGEA